MVCLIIRVAGLSRVRLIASNSEVAATQLAKEGAVPQLVMIATTSKDEARRLHPKDHSLPAAPLPTSADEHARQSSMRGAR